MERIAEFEEKQFAGTKRDTDFNSVLKHVKLGPMNESGGTALLHMVSGPTEKRGPLSINLLFVNQNVCCGCSKEPSQ